MPTIHDLIKIKRKAKGWSMGKLAKEVSARAGVDPPLVWQTVQQWEGGGSAPKRKLLPIVAQLLDTNVNDLLEAAPADGPSDMGIEQAVEVLAEGLMELQQIDRETAATLLGEFAIAPEGKWREWLLDLLAGSSAQPPPTEPDAIISRIIPRPDQGKPHKRKPRR